MGAVTQRSRSRAETGPLRHYADGHIITRRITAGTRKMIVRIFTRRRYATPEYVAALEDLNYNATCVRFKELREKSVRVLKLCKPQQDNAGLRMTGYLYSELDDEGYAILAEEGIHITPHEDDGQFAHTLTRDLVMLSLEIGVKEDGNLVLEYRDDLARSYQLEDKVIKGKDKKIKQYMVCDEIPVTLRSKSGGGVRHIAGLEIETGANRVKSKDKGRTAVENKFRNMIWLAESGELQRTHRFGNQYYWAFIFRTKLRKTWAMEVLEEMTQHNPALRKHFLFKEHPIFGKSKDKPRATGHILTEPWERVECEPLYLDGGKGARQQTV